MPLLDLVEFLDPKGDVLAARVPEDGYGELRLGSQCIVREGQLAFFARDGQLLDMLIPGRHTITTANIPLLVNFIKLPFGSRSPFRANVFFVSLKQHTDLKWETPQPIPMRDPQFGIVRLRAGGSFIIQVAEPRRLLTALVGSRGRFTVHDVVSQLRSTIIARLADAIAERMRERRLSVIDLVTEYDELSEIATEVLKDDFTSLGLSLTRFYINNITVPKELEQQFDRAGSVAAMGGMADYTRYKAAEALGDAAQSDGSGMVGAGVGLGAGVNLGAMMGQALASSLQPGAQPAPAPAAPAASGAAAAAPAPTPAPAPAPAAAAAGVNCPKCNQVLPAGAKFCFECGNSLQPPACPNCGREVSSGAKFCIECGTALGR